MNRQLKVNPLACNICFHSFPNGYELHVHKMMHFSKIKDAHELRLQVINNLNAERHVTHSRKNDDDSSNRPDSTSAAQPLSETTISDFAKPSDLTTQNLSDPSVKQLSCNVCNQQYLHRSELDAHVHNICDNSRFCCIKCHKTCQDDVSLHHHMLTVHKEEYCQECDAVFLSKEHLTAHMLTHMKVEPFVCNECGRHFEKRSSLSRHMRAHIGERPYACPECNKAYKKKEFLNIHLHHVHEAKYFCRECGDCFLSEEDLTAHMLTHTKVEPLVCNECRRYFENRSSLLLHMRVHIGERPCTCPGCNKPYRNKEFLNSHLRHVHGAKYFCRECGDYFLSEEDLTAHTLNHAR